MAASRPLRFVVLLLVGWIGARTLLLWPDPVPLPGLVEAIASPVAASPIRIANTGLPATLPGRARRAVLIAQPVSLPGSKYASVAIRGTPDPGFVTLALAALVKVEPSERWPVPQHGPVRAQPFLYAMPRLSGSGWLIARPGGTATPFASQLGGSQAGMRLTYALGDSRRVSLAARFSSALGARQREAALGIDWKPTALPIHLIAERRIGIEQARGGPSLGLIGGIGPTRIAGDVQIEAYGQAGGIVRGGIEGFADGAVRLTQPVAALGPAALDLGLGAWGGAQRGAARFDVGPAASIALPAAGRTVRVSLEWRQRIAGAARPGSGPALSIGTDF